MPKYFQGTEDLIGQKVICRSNELDSSLLVGKIIRIDIIGSRKIPVIADEKTGKEYIAMGNIMLFDDEIYNLVRNWPSQRLYNFMANNKLLLSILDTRE